MCVLECQTGLLVRREAEFLQMLDSPRIVACSDVVDDGRQLVRHDSPWRCDRRSVGAAAIA